MSMNLEKLAAQAARAMYHVNRMPYRDQCAHGMEYRRGFFNLYNDEAGQSKTVLYHPQSGYVFKRLGYCEPTNSSNRYIGEVDLDGKVYRVRLPEYYIIDDVMVQEYVHGETCCKSSKGWCAHAHQISEALHCEDAHGGNYKIVGDEIVLFDFEYLDID